MPPKTEAARRGDRRLRALGGDGRARPARRQRRRSSRRAIDIEEGRKFWAFQPPQDSRPRRRCKDAAWPRRDIDRFLLAGLEAKGLQAGRPTPTGATLLRRVTFDLTGLPPTPEEVEAFVADDVARRVREGRRPAAGLAAVRRALGPALARRRPLRRVERQARELRLPARLAVPRLRHRRVQRRQAVTTGSSCEQLAGDLLPAEDDRQRAEQTGRHRLPGASARRRTTSGSAVQFADGRRRRADRRDHRRRSSA